MSTAITVRYQAAGDDPGRVADDAKFLAWRLGDMGAADVTVDTVSDRGEVQITMTVAGGLLTALGRATRLLQVSSASDQAPGLLASATSMTVTAEPSAAPDPQLAVGP